MADRFPSIEDLQEGQPAEARNGDGDLLGGSDGADDFLARERAALGDDADQFAGPGDRKVAQVEDGEDDLLGEGDYNGTHAAGGDLDDFTDAFPAVDARNEAVAPGGSITGTGAPSYTAPVTTEEPEVIKEWRERRNMALQQRAEASEKKKQETVKAAQQNIDEFYENYNNKRDRGIAQTRKEAEDFLKSRESTTSGGTSWERITKLVDLSGKGTKGGASDSGKARFREMLVNLKKDEKAPGASGI